MRYLVKPIPGHTIVNLDYKAQEIGIAAALSQDPQMMIDYATGDPYLAMGKLARRIPPDGTKDTHGEIRGQFKALSLGINYMMGLETLARRIKGSLTEAGSLMVFHKQKYRTFWRWVESEVSGALLTKKIMTAYGWPMYLEDKWVIGSGGTEHLEETNIRSVQNFPMQATAVHILQIACMRLIEEGYEVTAPVHDSVCIQIPTEGFQSAIDGAMEILEEASRIVLNGFTINVEFKLAHYPERLGDDDPGAESMWKQVLELCPEITP